VAFSFSGCSVLSSGSRSSKTLPVSIASVDRSSLIVVLALIGPVGGSSAGITRSTNFSPNSVLGRIRARTFAGTSLTSAGFMASDIVATVPSEDSARTWPTRMPRSFTSAGRISWLPMEPVRSLSGTLVSNTLL